MNLCKVILVVIDCNVLVDKILGDGLVVVIGLILEGMLYLLIDDIDFVDENKKIVEYSLEKVKEYWVKVKKELGIIIFKMDIVVDDVDFMKKLVEYI